MPVEDFTNVNRMLEQLRDLRPSMTSLDALVDVGDRTFVILTWATGEIFALDISTITEPMEVLWNGDPIEVVG